MPWSYGWVAPCVMEVRADKLYDTLILEKVDQVCQELTAQGIYHAWRGSLSSSTEVIYRLYVAA